MSRYNVIFESKETILGVVPQANDWVTYSCLLKIADGGKFPVSLEILHPKSLKGLYPLARTTCEEVRYCFQ